MANLCESAELFLLFMLSASSVVKSRGCFAEGAAATDAKPRKRYDFYHPEDGLYAAKRRPRFQTCTRRLRARLRRPRSRVRSIDPCHPWLPLPFSPSCIFVSICGSLPKIFLEPRRGDQVKATSMCIPVQQKFAAKIGSFS